MASRYQDLLNNRNVRPEDGGFSASRPPRTKPGDHLSWLAKRAKEGRWEELVDYVNSDEPLTRQGRAAVALLLQQLLEPRQGGPSGTPTEKEEAIDVAVWFMHAARDIFLAPGARLTSDELKELASKAAEKINAEYLQADLKADDLIGSFASKRLKGDPSTKSKYKIGPTNHAEYVVRNQMRFVGRPIVDELVKALATVSGKVKAVKA